MRWASPGRLAVAADERQPLAGRQLDDVLARAGRSAASGRAGPGGSRPGARPGRPRRARGGPSRRARRACRGSSSGARRPSRPRPGARASRGSREAGPMVATILVRRMRRHGIGPAAPAADQRRVAPSIERVLGPTRPLPRVGAPRAHRALRRRLRGGARSSRCATTDGGSRSRGEGGEVLEFVLNPATARFVSAAQRTGPRLELLGGALSEAPHGRLHVGEVLGAVRAQRLAHPRALLAARPARSAPEQLALALDRRRPRSSSARPGARTAARTPAARRPRATAARRRARACVLPPRAGASASRAASARCPRASA